MKTIVPTYCLAAIAGGALFFTAGLASAAAPKEYQITGPVTAVTDTTVTLQVRKEVWEISKDATTKVTGGDVKVGDKVTVHYTMTAGSIEDKGPAPAKAPKTAATPAAGGAAASPAKP